MKRPSDIWNDKRYLELLQEFPLIPIASDKELKKALTIVDTLVVRGFENLTPGEEAYLDVLSDLVEKYEHEHYPIPDVTEAEMLAHLIEARGMTQRELAEATNIQESAISNLLAGRRPFSRNHILRFSRYFKVTPAVFFPNEPKARD